jgi:prolyl oligopeptidase
MVYPNTRRIEQVDTYFGVKVPDPYRWLEADIRGSKEVADWAAEENKVTFSYLDRISEREKIHRRLTECWNFAQYSVAFKAGGRYYYLKNDGLQNQAVLYVLDTLEAAPRVLLDPNAWSKDGTIALGGLGFSDDGRYAAYSRAEAGSDWSRWHVLEIASGKVLSDELRWTKFSRASWSKDGKGFFYSRYEEPKRGAEFQALNFNNRVCYHRVGTPQAADELVYFRPEHPDWQYDAEASEDGHWLVIATHLGTDDRCRVTVRDLSAEKGDSPHLCAAPFGPFRQMGTVPFFHAAKPIELVDNFQHEYDFLGNEGSVLYFKTDLDAPRRRLVAIDLNGPPLPPGEGQGVRGTAKNASHSASPSPRPSPGGRGGLVFKEIIPQAAETLVAAQFVGNCFIVTYLADVRPRVRIFSQAGRFDREVDLPGIGAVAGFHGKQTDRETFYTFSSFNRPATVYHYNLASGASRVFRQPELKFRPDDYEVRQVFYRSKDGTRVPMFIAHKKGLRLDGARPTLLYGYGGFNISLLPVFSVGRLVWMEMGGVYAQPNLRGGGEYGEAWHKAGIKLKKQNVFDDFIAAAEWLVANHYTRPGRLAIQGGSNGGLLVGAVMTQRPELFGACLPAVGVMDMLRFQKFTEGRTWVDDYGSSDDRREFKALLAYSPYHNIRPGTCYPATLVTTADTDDRVVPGHSFKFIAALQAAQGCPKPVLIRIATRAGHGMGKPTGKRIAEITDEWAFLVKNLGMTVP